MIQIDWFLCTVFALFATLCMVIAFIKLTNLGCPDIVCKRPVKIISART